MPGRASHQGTPVQHEDELHASGDSGVMMLGVRNDTRASICNADGDYTPPSFDDAGAMLVNMTGAYAGAAYVDAAAANVHEPAVNTAAVVTYAAGGGSVRHFISGVAWSYNAAPTAGVLTITDGGTTVFTTDVTAGGPGFQDFAPVLRFGADSAVVVTLAAAGAAVTGIVSVKGHWSA